jgi:hypothetical protein
LLPSLTWLVKFDLRASLPVLVVTFSADST